MYNEIGHYMLIMSLVVTLAQTLMPAIGVTIRHQRLTLFGANLALVSFLCTALAFAALTNAYLASDFSLLNVYANSHSQLPTLYKFTSVWGNHEGSMLLWVLILTSFGALVFIFGRNLPQRVLGIVLSVLGFISFAFNLFILLTSNPFTRLAPIPLEGEDLNPVLQDIGLAIHPPLLYLGYVGFAVSFAFAIAALILGKTDASWARWVRPWTLFAWVCLTLGIAMGSYWAYYELGWGGWWFWDPVENASFMPWLTGTALLHSAIVVEKREALKVWTVFLAIVTFSLSLLGTFLVRSGVLTSVHAFASDPERGVFILILLLLIIGGSFTLFAIQAPKMRTGGLFHPISREGSLVFNNVFLTIASASVLTGTLYPIAREAFDGAAISVGPPYFELIFIPLMLPLLILLPFGPMMNWKRALFSTIARRLWLAMVMCALAFVVVLIFIDRSTLFASLGIGIALWLMVGVLTDVFLRGGFNRYSFGYACRRMFNVPLSTYGTWLAHFGVGVLLTGIISERTWQEENILTMKIGDQTALSGYTISLESLTPRKGPNFAETIARFKVESDNQATFYIASSKRVYDARQMPTTEVGLHTSWFSQIYLSLGELSGDGTLVVRLHHKPFVLLIWLGPLLMGVGGIFSLLDRRLRLGAPKTKRVVKPNKVSGMASILLVIMTILALSHQASAVEPDEILSDPALEARARDISKELRCLVCQNENIDASSADLAKDLRVLLRERLTKGDTNEEVIDFVTSRYGEFVLLRPQFNYANLPLWGLPFLLLIVVAFGLFRFYRTDKTERSIEKSELSQAEESRIASITEE